MRNNGNQSTQQGDASLVNLVIRALEDPRYEWRTIDGVSEQTGIPAPKVQEMLENLQQYVVRSSIPDESGRNLYTTRKHYRQTHGLGSRILSALSDKVA
jgi:hypothetical protein